MKYFYASIILIILTFTANAQIAANGNFTLDQAVIATGGGTSSGGTITVEGTTAQAVAGINSTNSTYRIDSGFWTAQPLAPTAAEVSISGRVLTANGNGIRNVRLTLTNGNGVVRSIQTSSFGYFRFENIEVGQTYIINIRSKNYIFANPTQIISVQDTIIDLNFTAETNE